MVHLPAMWNLGYIETKMKNKIQVGQIHLTHPKDQNFTALYAEAFSKQQESVDLFGVFEVATGSPQENKALQAEHERLVGLIVGAFKKSYVSSPIIDKDSFERALAAVNTSLSRSLSRGKAGWFGKLNACLVAVHKNELTLSITGASQAFLMRDNDLSLLTDGLMEDKIRPVKIFSSYTTGGLKNGDRMVFTTGQLSNYLSIERLQESLQEDTLNEACQEIIATLADIKTVGFATFVCELFAGPVPVTSPAQAIISQATSGKGWLSSIWNLLKGLAYVIFLVLKFLWKVISGIGALISRLVKKPRPQAVSSSPRFGIAKRKYIFAAIGLIVVLLLGNIAYGYAKKLLTKETGDKEGQLAKIEQLLDGAEAAVIYKDEKKVAASAAEAEQLLAQTREVRPSEKWQSLDSRLRELKEKINKITAAEPPVTLTTFPNIPTNLIRSPNGALGWNRDSGSFAFYDFRLGETKSILKSQNTGELVTGDYVGGSHGYVFAGRKGQFRKLDPASDQIAGYDNSAPDPNLATGLSSGNLVSFGTGSSARLYLLDTAQNQIWRIRANETGLSPSERWLKESASLAGAVDMAIDGNIFLLRNSTVDKFFNGQKQDFELSPVIPPLQNATAIFTNENSKNLYVLDPQQSRLLVFDKTGKLQSQITDDKFRDASDLYADETAKLIYIIAGSELLQVTMP